MKKITLLFVALFAVGMTSLQAQSCAKMKASCASKTTVAKASCGGSSAAAQLASLDDTVEERKCAETGKVSYVRKEECPATGKVVFTNLSYDGEMGKFVNMSPSAKKACCDKDKQTGCCSGAAEGTATKASLDGKAHCTPAEKAACTPAEKAACKAKGTKVAEADTKAEKSQKGS